MTRLRRKRSNAPFAAFGGFAAGVAFTSILAWQGAVRTGLSDGVPPEDCGHAVLDGVDPLEERVSTAAPKTRDTRDPAVVAPPRIGADPIEALRARGLLIPVEGYDRGSLRSSFSEPRGANRVHEAIDLLAPRHTPVLAVEDGVIARLFTSKAGGITIYQFDPTMTFVYYYAHLERYAAELGDDSAVRRGQVIGYVGTSGNAPANTPHLHFAIFRLTEKKQWWDGVPVDPFEVLR